jgi:hypothetical protein
MIRLTFRVLDAHAEKYAAVPTLSFRLEIREATSQPVHAMLLRCQINIEPRRRRHATSEQERLTDLFGTPDRWSETQRPILWTQTTINVPAFRESIEIDVPVPCTYDFEVTAAKYLTALESGEIPLLLLFSGTVFTKTETGFYVQPIPWDREASYRMPITTWRELMDAYFPNAAWIRVNRETLEILQRHRAANGFSTWDETILEGALK